MFVHVCLYGGFLLLFLWLFVFLFLLFISLYSDLLAFILEPTQFRLSSTRDLILSQLFQLAFLYLGIQHKPLATTVIYPLKSIASYHYFLNEFIHRFLGCSSFYCTIFYFKIFHFTYQSQSPLPSSCPILSPPNSHSKD